MHRREGLEKMEREKLKQAERDREMKERDEKRRQEKLVEQNLLMQLNANESSPKLPAKSKFVCISISISLFNLSPETLFTHLLLIRHKLNMCNLFFLPKTQFNF